MERVRLGRTRLEVSPAGLDCGGYSRLAFGGDQFWQCMVGTKQVIRPIDQHQLISVRHPRPPPRDQNWRIALNEVLQTILRPSRLLIPK